MATSSLLFEFPVPSAPEMTNANKAKPITNIKKNDFSLILPNTATFKFYRHEFTIS